MWGSAIAGGGALEDDNTCRQTQEICGGVYSCCADANRPEKGLAMKVSWTMGHGPWAMGHSPRLGAQLPRARLERSLGVG
jgi:hypothetical protein